jgi:hypothetical protein
MATIKTDLIEIKKALRRHRGAVKDVCERAGCTREMVRLVLNGARKSERVLSICAEVAIERERQANETRMRIRSISKQLQSLSATSAIAV